MRNYMRLTRTELKKQVTVIQRVSGTRPLTIWRRNSSLCAEAKFRYSNMFKFDKWVGRPCCTQTYIGPTCPTKWPQAQPPLSTLYLLSHQRLVWQPNDMLIIPRCAKVSFQSHFGEQWRIGFVFGRTDQWSGHVLWGRRCGSKISERAGVHQGRPHACSPEKFWKIESETGYF